MQNGVENSCFWHEPKYRDSLRRRQNAFAALCGVAGACDVVVRFNLPEKTMFPPTTQTSIRRTGRMKVE